MKNKRDLEDELYQKVANLPRIPTHLEKTMDLWYLLVLKQRLKEDR